MRILQDMGIKLPKSALLPLAFLMFAGTSWGAISACPTTAGTAVTLASFANADAAADGCRNVDKSCDTFTIGTAPNFTAADGSCSGKSCSSPVTPALTNILVYSTGTAASGSTAGPVNLFFLPGAGNYNWTLNGDGTQAQNATINYNMSANTGGAYPTPTAPYTNWAINGLTFTPTLTGMSNDVGNGAIITQVLCLSATSTVIGTGGCLATNRVTITATYTPTGGTTGTYACSGGANIACAASNSNVATFAAVLAASSSVTFDLDRISGSGNLVSLGSILSSYSEIAVTPEPSTFGMLGAALVGVGFLARRRRKV